MVAVSSTISQVTSSSHIVTTSSAASSEIAAALIGSGATLFAALLGGYFLLMQLRRQGVAALDQSRRNEAMRLKLGIYKEIIATCEEITDKEVAFSSFLNRIWISLGSAHALKRVGRAYPRIPERYPQIQELYYSALMASTKIVTTVEQWRIVDKRLDIFQTAVNAIRHDLDEVWFEYSRFVMTLLPVEAPVTGEPVPWSLPSDASLQRHEQLMFKMTEAMGTLAALVTDFQNEMQTLLVGELFDNRVAARVPLDPKRVVVTLDRHEELEHHFNTATAWGIWKAELEARTRRELGLDES